MPHTCSLCGHVTFKTYHEYETHRAVHHGIKQNIKPEKVTGRSPTKIIEDAEATWLKPHLVSGESPLVIIATSEEHLEACRCNQCFQKQLDKVVELSTKSLNEGVDHAE